MILHTMSASQKILDDRTAAEDRLEGFPIMREALTLKRECDRVTTCSDDHYLNAKMKYTTSKKHALNKHKEVC